MNRAVMEAINRITRGDGDFAGASSTIIDPVVLAAVHSFTQGNSRLIDNLMTDALTIGSQQDKKVIDAEIIRAAVDNQGLY